MGYNGEGEASYPNGDTYKGPFVEGMRCGKNGIYTYLAGEDKEAEVYTGEWKSNKKNGIGKQNYEGLGQYYGHWVDGEKHGEGVMIYSNKDIYSGQWKNGQKDGQGTYVFNDTMMKYVGSFRGGNITKGKWVYPNGTFFEGNFDNNMPKGVGKWNFKNGNTVEGLYTQIMRADVDSESLKLAWKTLSDLTQAF